MTPLVWSTEPMGPSWVRLSRRMDARCHLLANNTHTLCGLRYISAATRKGAECCKRCVAIDNRLTAKEKLNDVV